MNNNYNNNNNNRLSVYIPYVTRQNNAETITNVFYNTLVGQVERVDFNHHKTRNNAYEAFVHFYPYDSNVMRKVVQQHSHNRTYKLVVPGTTEYWVLCRNKHPLPDTMLNIHQVADQMASLETRVEELTKMVSMIPELTNTIASLNLRVRYLEDPEWENEAAEGGRLTMEDLSATSSIMDTNITSTEDSVFENLVMDADLADTTNAVVDDDESLSLSSDSCSNYYDSDADNTSEERENGSRDQRIARIAPILDWTPIHIPETSYIGGGAEEEEDDMLIC